MAFIKIHGVLVDIPVEIAPDVHKACITKDKKGVRQLLAQCQNALCSVMVAILLCCRKFTKSLTDIGFKTNPCDPCITNKITEGKQMMMCFHVDDYKLSYCKHKVNDCMVRWLHKEHEQRMFEDGLGKMAVSRGKVHKCLGMWHLILPKQGEPWTKMFKGKEWTWCKHHKCWAQHTGEDCCEGKKNSSAMAETPEHAATMAAIGIKDVEEEETDE